MASSIAIIGAGIAGLSAGCYARMNGYESQIFEMHDKPGGLCTSWQRHGYTFDGCIEWLVGTNPEGSFYRVWNELGALPGRDIVQHAELSRYEGADGKVLVVHRDPAQLCAHLKQLSPEDAGSIDALAKAIGHFRRIRFNLERPRGVRQVAEQLRRLLDMTPTATDLLRYRKTSVKDWAEGFRDPFLREALGAQFALPDFPFLAMVAVLAAQANSDAGYPVGGSLPFAQSIEQRYLDLGGVIRYGRRVKRIMVEHDRAVGVELEDGEQHRADIVVSAADGYSTLFHMLDGRYLDHALRERFATLPRFPSIVRVSLGVDMDLSTEPHEVNFPLAYTVRVDGQPHQRMVMRHYGYDPTMAPAGKSVVVVSLPSSYEAWRTLRGHLDHYTNAKNCVGDDVMRAIDRRLPGFADKVETVDVATPITFERYTGNWNGSVEGWLLTTRTLSMRMASTVPGLTGLFMIGQWVHPGGGLPTAAWSARNLIRRLCDKQGKRFETSSARGPSKVSIVPHEVMAQA